MRRKIASDHLAQPRNRSGFNIYATSAINFNGRSLAGFALSLFHAKGLRCIVWMSHAHPRPRPKPYCAGLKHQSASSSVEA
ncbi:hypothetical protein TNIN_372811 [Trichonephila inaurata madagascariensis]|uniref:Uncharacterized protein n=1 Tax=Trichonephila inaurata madagascariensis TaxID=2747483 RepID=A0A8X6WVR3_9ARAC|nr:hypothetical protein TNIN_372811 [Trichonephila inaurata madagascariensis]